MKKILITGASGLLGSKIVDKAQKGYRIYPTYTKQTVLPNSLKMNITRAEQVKDVLRKIKPDVVIHTAAETNVDRCEIDKDHALKVNAEGTRILAEVCRKVNARMIYVSTDYVFDGEKGCYTEDDKPNPVNYYGLTKLMGERHVAELCESFTILRTSVLYGFHSKKLNFAMWVWKALRENKTLTVVEDHYNSPTLADNLADVILEMIDTGLEGRVYHTAGNERISRYHFAQEIAKVIGLNSHCIQPIKMSELKAWVAKRPKDSSLGIEKVKKEIDTKLLDVKQGLREMKKSWAKTL